MDGFSLIMSAKLLAKSFVWRIPSYIIESAKLLATVHQFFDFGGKTYIQFKLSLSTVRDTVQQEVINNTSIVLFYS